MPKDFKEYKHHRKIAEAYEKAVEIQEAIALTICQPNGDVKEYEGHLAVSDVLNKIDAMVRLFEKSIQDSDFQDSSGKVIEIICNLYDLAQIKMAEAKKQAKSYMEKASGTSVEDVPEEEIISDLGDTEEEPGNDEREITFKTRGPMQTPGEELDASESPPEYNSES